MDQSTRFAAPSSEIPITGAVRTALKFCRHCGTAWQQQSIECQACLLRRAPSPFQFTSSHESDDVRSSLVLYFLLLGICLSGMLVGRATRSPTDTMLGAEVVISVLVIVWAVVQWNQNLSGLLSLPSFGWFFAAIGLSFVTFAIATGAIRGVQIWLDVPPLKGSMKSALPGYGLGIVILATAVQPAVIEELAFRGIILGGLRRTLNVSEAIVVSAMMFMVLHLSPARFPHTLALGLAAGFLRMRSKSILPCMVMHFCHNFLCIAQEWV